MKCALEQLLSLLLLQILTGVDCGESLGKTQVEFMRTILLHWRRVLELTIHWLVAISYLKCWMVSLLFCFVYKSTHSACLQVACLVSKASNLEIFMDILVYIHEPI